MSLAGRRVGWGAVAVLAAQVALAKAPDPPSTDARGERSTDARGEPKKPGFRYRLELADDVRFKLADKKRDEAIEQLKVLIPRFDDDAKEKPDLLYQLAEFYWEKHRYLYAQEEKKSEQAWKAHDAAKAKGQRPPDPGPADHSKSERFRREAMALYETLLDKYSSYERLDEVLFSMGFNLQQLQKPAQAVARYKELIQRYPNSRFVPDTWVQLGDHAFEQNDLEGARSAFLNAQKSEDPKLSSYALYKLAWCDYNAHEYDAAAKKLREVVELADRRGTSLVDLRKEALNDLVAAYTALDQPDEADRYFASKVDAARRVTLVAKLADALVEAGHDDSALALYARLIAEDPMRDQAPLFQTSVVRALAKQGKRAQVGAEAKKLSERYRPGSDWWKAHQNTPASLRAAFDAAEEAMRALVADYHKEAQQTHHVETYRLARDLYQRYLEAFASSTDPAWVADAAFEQLFFYAEILWTLEEWEPAFDAYDRVAHFPKPTNDTYRKIAAFNAVLAADKLLKLERGQLFRSDLKDGQRVDEKKAKGGVEVQVAAPARKEPTELEEKPLSKAEERLVRTCDAYVEVAHSGSKEELDIRYQAALLLYDKNHAEDAAGRFTEIIARWPEEGRAQTAADLTMHVLEARGQWTELAKVSKELFENRRLAKPGTPFTQRLQAVVEGAQYKWIDEVIYKEQKDAKRAAEQFVLYAQQFPKSRWADRALAYAMLLLRDQGEPERAIELGERALRDFPGSPVELKLRYALAGLYAQLAWLPKAAQMSEAFVEAYDKRRRDLPKEPRKPPSHAKAPVAEGTAEETAPTAGGADLLEEAAGWVPDAQYNAATWYGSVGELDKAAAAYRSYVKRFAERPDAPQAAYAMGVLYEGARRWADAARSFEAFDSRFGRDPRVPPQQAFLARYRALQAHLSSKDAKKATALQAELLRSYGGLPEKARQEDPVKAAFAHLRFLQLEPAWKEFQDIRFVRLATVQRDLPRKQRKLRELEQGYLAVLQLGVGEWGLAALTRVGLAYSDLRKNILDSPVPPRLSEEEEQQYKDELLKLALPLEDQADQALQKALGRAYQLGLYGEWTLAAQEQLNALKPGSYPKARALALVDSQSPRCPDKAEADARAALARSKDDPAAYHALALCALDQGHEALAETFAQLARRTGEKDPAIANTLALIWAKRSEWPRAVAELQRAVALDPAFAPAQLNLGALALQHRDYATAEQAFGRALQAAPASRAATSARAWALEGLVASDPQRGPDAGQAYEKVLALAPADPEAICGAAFGYAAAAQGYARAVAFLEKCREVGATPQQKLAAEAKLKTIQAVLGAQGSPGQGGSGVAKEPPATAPQ